MMIKPLKYHPLVLLAALFIVAFIAVACDDRTVDPLEDTPGLFSVYGALSLHQNPNYIRVKDLGQAFIENEGRELGAIVTIEDMQEGEVTTLRDSVVEFSGQLTHNFILDRDLKPQRSYRLTVENNRSGKSVSSIATTPAVTETNVVPSANVSCSGPLTFTFENVVRPERVRMTIGFFHEDMLKTEIVGRINELEYRDGVDAMFLRTTPLDLLMAVFPNPRLGDPRFDQDSLLPLVLCNELDSKEVVVQYIHFGPEWENYEGAGVADPTESLDIEGGLGFLGALRRDTLSFTVDTTSAF